MRGSRWNGCNYSHMRITDGDAAPRFLSDLLGELYSGIVIRQFEHDDASSSREGSWVRYMDEDWRRRLLAHCEARRPGDDSSSCVAVSAWQAMRISALKTARQCFRLRPQARRFLFETFGPRQQLFETPPFKHGAYFPIRGRRGLPRDVITIKATDRAVIPTNDLGCAWFLIDYNFGLGRQLRRPYSRCKAAFLACNSLINSPMPSSVC